HVSRGPSWRKRIPRRRRSPAPLLACNALRPAPPRAPRFSSSACGSSRTFQFVPAFRAPVTFDRDGARAAMDALDGAPVFEPVEQTRRGAARGKAQFDPQILAARHGAGAGMKGADGFDAGALAFGEHHHARRLHDRGATLAEKLTVASQAICFRAALKRGSGGIAPCETESEKPATPRNMARTTKALWAGFMGGLLRVKSDPAASLCSCYVLIELELIRSFVNQIGCFYFGAVRVHSAYEPARPPAPGARPVATGPRREAQHDVGVDRPL